MPSGVDPVAGGGESEIARADRDRGVDCRCRVESNRVVVRTGDTTSHDPIRCDGFPGIDNCRNRDEAGRGDIAAEVKPPARR